MQRVHNLRVKHKPISHDCKNCNDVIVSDIHLIINILGQVFYSGRVRISLGAVRAFSENIND